MMKQVRKRKPEGKKDGFEPMFETLAILDQGKKIPESNVTVPTNIGINEAKAWVDDNEK